MNFPMTVLQIEEVLKNKGFGFILRSFTIAIKYDDYIQLALKYPKIEL